MTDTTDTIAPARDTNVMFVDVAGTRYVVDLFALKGTDWRDIRKETGMRPLDFGVLVLANDIEAVAALVWIAGRADTPSLTYDEVLGSLTIGDLNVGPRMSLRLADVDEPAVSYELAPDRIDINVGLKGDTVDEVVESLRSLPDPA